MSPETAYVESTLGFTDESNHDTEDEGWSEGSQHEEDQVDEDQDDEEQANEDQASEDPDDEKFVSSIMSVCRNFTNTMKDLQRKRNDSWNASRAARCHRDRAIAAKSAAKVDLETKEDKVETLRDRLDALKQQLLTAEEELRQSREKFDRCSTEEEKANEKYRYTVKDIKKCDKAYQQVAEHMLEHSQRTRIVSAPAPKRREENQGCRMNL